MLAAGRVEVRETVARVYAELQAQIDMRRPKCSTSGRCCRFDEYGHRLYVTTMELAAFAHSLSDESKVLGLQSVGAGCVFQVDGLCSVHAIRPFGCRVFFCDSTSDDWQHAQYERFHGELKRLHNALAVPYAYTEWRQALREIGLGGAVEAQPGAKRLSLPQLLL